MAKTNPFANRRQGQKMRFSYTSLWQYDMPSGFCLFLSLVSSIRYFWSKPNSKNLAPRKEHELFCSGGQPHLTGGESRSEACTL